MKESNTFVFGVTMDQLKKKFLNSIKGPFMRELTIDAYFAAMRQPQRDIRTPKVCA